MFLLSFDPGTSGALSIFKDDTLIEVLDLPSFEKGTGHILDFHSLVSMIHPYYGKAIAVVEDVHAVPSSGCASAFKFGYGLAVIHCAISVEGIPMHLLKPREWQKVHGIKGKEKDLSRQKAIQLFPHLKDRFARKLDHNRADASLMGYSYLKLNP